MRKILVFMLALMLLAPVVAVSSAYAQRSHRKRNEYMLGGGAAGAVIGGLAGGGKGALIGAGAGAAGGYLAHRYVQRRHARRYAYERRRESRRYYYTRRDERGRPYYYERAHH